VSSVEAGPLFSDELSNRNLVGLLYRELLEASPISKIHVPTVTPSLVSVGFVLSVVDDTAHLDFDFAE
jgi:hypothetical protein